MVDLAGIMDLERIAAVVVPPNRRLVATSGHVARGEDGKHPEEYEDEFTIAFEVLLLPIHSVGTSGRYLTRLDDRELRNAVDPSLTSEEIWGSVYQINTYHAGGISKEIFDELVKVARGFFKGHTPAWTAVEVKSLKRRSAA